MEIEEEMHKREGSQEGQVLDGDCTSLAAEGIGDVAVTVAITLVSWGAHVVFRPCWKDARERNKNSGQYFKKR